MYIYLFIYDLTFNIICNISSLYIELEILRVEKSLYIIHGDKI